MFKKCQLDTKPRGHQPAAVHLCSTDDCMGLRSSHCQLAGQATEHAIARLRAAQRELCGCLASADTPQSMAAPPPCSHLHMECAWCGALVIKLDRREAGTTTEPRQAATPRRAGHARIQWGIQTWPPLVAAWLPRHALSAMHGRLSGAPNHSKCSPNGRATQNAPPAFHATPSAWPLAAPPPSGTAPAPRQAPPPQQRRARKAAGRAPAWGGSGGGRGHHEAGGGAA